MPIRWYPHIEDWIPLSEAAHRKIITAFEKGDSGTAAVTASRHIREAGELLIAHFESTGRWSPTPPPGS